MYQLSGGIIHGSKRGRILGFPTANLKLDLGLKIPPAGVYAAKVKIQTENFKNQTYLAACSVGQAKTFDDLEVKIEFFILDFSANIYQKKIKAKLFQKIREMQKFTSLKELKTAIKSDVQKVREILS